MVAALEAPVNDFLGVVMTNLTEQFHADQLLDDQEAEEDEGSLERMKTKQSQN